MNNCSQSRQFPLRPSQVVRTSDPERRHGLHRLVRLNVIKIKSDISKHRRSFEILIVDDEPLVGQAVGMVLTRLGHGSTFCANPREALGKLQHRPIDLIITDYRMPEMTGLEFAREVQNQNQAIPVILMTGYASSLSLSQIDLTRFKTVLHKPFDLASISLALSKTALN